MLDFDLGGVSSAGKPLPEGDYAFRIEDATIKLSKAGDSHNLKLKMVVISDDETGRPHSENLNIHPERLGYLKAFLTALWGVDDDEVGAISFDASEEDGTVNGINDRPLIGAEIGGTIKHRDNYGNVVAWFTAS